MTRKLMLIGLLGLLLTVGNAQKTFEQHFKAFDRIQQQEKVYVQTDRTLYQPNNEIWLNAFVTNDENCPSTLSQEVYVELLNPKGVTIQSRVLRNIGGCASGQFKLNRDGVGGIYKIRAYTYWMQNFDEEHCFEKNITVQNVVLPNVLLQLDFEKEAYGVGSQVIASLKARTKENLLLTNKKLSFEVQLAGKSLCTEVAHTDENGTAYLVFTLPDSLNTTDGLLNIQVEQDGMVEAISRSIPIVLNNLDVQFLPEGGHLISNQLNRVAFKVLNEFGKPADVKAELLNEENQVVKSFESYHQGMGAFEFIPKEGVHYTVRILEPQGIEKNWSLPLSSNGKIGLYLKAQEKEQLVLNVYSNKKQSLRIVAQQQGTLWFNKKITAKSGANTLSILTAEMPMGIVQLTVFDQNEQPQCERLVFVNKDRHLDINIRTDKESYLPREEVELTIQATDETGKGVVGNFALAVTDDKQHTFIDDKQDNILSYLLMSSDLKGTIEEPNFYFDPKEEKASKALDYVLLTHGWRRYDWNDLLATDLEAWSDSLLFDVESDEISGYLKINGVLYPEKRIFLSERNARFSRKKALQSVITNKNGFFKFKQVGLKFPVYVGLKHQGKWHVVKIENYSKAGLKLIKKKDAEALINKGNSRIRYTPSGRHDAGLRGQVIDNDEGLPFANVVLEKDGVQVSRTQTDFDGYYTFSNIEDGIHDLIVSYVGFPSVKTEGVVLRSGQVVLLDVQMEEGAFYSSRGRTPTEEFILIDAQVLEQQKAKQQEKKKAAVTITTATIGNLPALEDVIVRDYRIPLIDQDAISGGQTLGAEDIKNLATRSVTSIVATTAGVNQLDEGEAISSNGSRSSSNDTYIDGVRIVGNFGVSEIDIEDVQVITSGVPAAYENAKARSEEVYVRAYNIPTIDQSNTIGGQTLRSSDIVLGSSGDGGDYYNRNNSNYTRSYDKVKFRQVGVKSYSKIVRFYTPKYKIGQAVERRTDFRKTIYWNPKITTNEEGLATVTYCNSDEVTTFRASVEGLSKNGQLGLGEHTYSVQLPFSLTTKLPPVLSYWDTLTIPIVLKNTTKKALKGQLTINAPYVLTLLDSIPTEITIPANDVKVVYATYLTKERQGTCNLTIGFEGQGFKDVVQEKIRIISKGFPASYSMAGGANKQDSFIVDPYYKGSFNAELKLYPDLLDGLMDGVAGIIREPHGCFEQVSSSNYPNILALQLMKETGNLNPEIRQQALDYLKKGYQKLLAYEIEGGGFEWYGNGSAHEGLTAYGLAQFKDLEAVYDKTDADVIARTKQFLLNRRDGKGGFKQHTGRYGFSGNRPAVFNAYITWALSKVGTTGIDREINTVVAEAIKKKDLYRMSLACLTLFNVEKTAAAESLLATIVDQIKKIGIEQVHAETTLTYSGGNANRIETLAWVGLAMLQSNKVDGGLLEMLVRHILDHRERGRFGSSQATTMALKLLTAYQKEYVKVKDNGRYNLYINEQLVASDAYIKGKTKKIQLRNLQQYLSVGKNTIQLKFEGTALPFAFDTEWNAIQPQTTTSCPLELSTALQSKKSKLGETVRMNIQLKNAKATIQPSPMAIVGIPAGLSLQPWQLKELQEKGAFDYYELRNKQLVLYFRELDANQTKQIALDLKADVLGIYTAQTSSAYLYYNDEQKHWIKGTSVVIVE